MMNKKLKNKLLKNGYKGGFELSELIKACGKGFWTLERGYEVDKINPPDEWMATSEKITRHGFTPEEAVANLWLKLNMVNTPDFILSCTPSELIVSRDKR